MVLVSLGFAGECLFRSWALADAGEILLGIGRGRPETVDTSHMAFACLHKRNIQSKTTIQQAVGLPITEDSDVLEPSVCNYPWGS